MKNIKKITAIIISVILVFALISCSEDAMCTTHKDANTDGICDVCGKMFNKKPAVCEEHKDADGDELCDECGEKIESPEPPICTNHTDPDGDNICNYCGNSIAEQGSDQGNGGGSLGDYGNVNDNEWDS